MAFIVTEPDPDTGRAILVIVVIIIVIANDHQAAALEAAESRRDPAFLPVLNVGIGDDLRIAPALATVGAFERRDLGGFLGPMLVIVAKYEHHPAGGKTDDIRILGESS